MARSRRYREDLTYAEWHRHRLEELYERDGHRLDMCDRDWTEFCTACRAPLVIVEEVVDHGQNPLEKGVTVTRKLAKWAQIKAYYLVIHAPRPESVQREIDELGRRISTLEAAYPIVGFHARQLVPAGTPLLPFTPDQWAEQIRIWHREHHAVCRKAQQTRILLPINEGRIWEVRRRSRLHTAAEDQAELFLPEGA